MKRTCLLAGVAGAVVLAAFAWAGQGPEGEGPDGRDDGPRGHGGVGALLHNEELAKELGVTDEQIKTIRDGMYQHRQEMIKLRAAQETAQLEVRRLMESDSTDTNAVMKALDNAISAEGDIRKTQAMEMLQVRAILGPDVAKKLKDYLRSHLDDDQRGPRFGQGQGGSDRRGPGQGNGWRRGGSPDGDEQGQGPAWKHNQMTSPDEGEEGTDR